jgi:hypothetical protein
MKKCKPEIMNAIAWTSMDQFGIAWNRGAPG